MSRGMMNPADIAAWEQGKVDARRARELVDASLDPHCVLYRDHGPDRLVAAALVYATLAR